MIDAFGLNFPCASGEGLEGLGLSVWPRAGGKPVTPTSAMKGMDV